MGRRSTALVLTGALCAGTAGIGLPAALAGAQLSSSSAGPSVLVKGSTLSAGSSLASGAQLTSPGGRYRLVMQRDGNLVLYWLSQFVWDTKTGNHSGAHATLQRDGNFVVYAGTTALWQSKSGGHASASFKLSLLSDGNFVITAPSGSGIWSSKTETHGVRIQREASPSFPKDAGDPTDLRIGSDYVAFTTGTALGNHIQAVIDPHGPASGYSSYTGQSYGSTALATTPGWQEPNTQTSPSILHYGGHWVMFYDASLKGHAAGTGYDCLSVATASTITPQSPKFTDHSTSPLKCDNPVGLLDPAAFVDPKSDKAYLLWKSNDGASTQASHIWSVQLNSSGTGFASTPKIIWTNDTAHFKWETTLDNPSLAYANGRYFLMFSVGNFLSKSYAEAFAICQGPGGTCYQPSGGPFLSTYGHAYGPAGGSLFTDAVGNWWIVYEAWSSSTCQNYGCGAIREMYVAPIDLGG